MPAGDNFSNGSVGMSDVPSKINHWPVHYLKKHSLTVIINIDQCII